MEQSVVAQPGWLPGLNGSTTAHEPIRDLPQVVVDIAARLVRARRSSLLLPSSEYGVLRLAASIGLDDEVADQVRVRLGEPVAGIVAASRQTIASNDRSVRLDRESRGYVTGSYISLPVPLDAQYCGVLSVADPLHADGFNHDDQEALERFAFQIATTLSYSQVKQRTESLERTVQQLRRQVILVQEAERQRIARDLHDEAGHAITAAILRLDVEIAQQSRDSSALSTLHTTREELVECAKSLHEIAFNLRPRILEDFGLHAALRSLARYTMGISDLDVSVEIAGDQWTLDELSELAILRIVQEALTNTRKYARATTVSIAFHYESTYVTVHVEDDGVGLGTQRLPSPQERTRVPMGIAGMRDRIELLGGQFWIGRGPKGGTLVSAMLPR